MSLSNDLVSQFVKSVRPESKETKESIVYGTVVADGSGALCVLLDGGDSKNPTPIITTSGISEGNRVMVMIKNHSAIVIGNLDDPSAGAKQVNSVGESATSAEKQAQSAAAQAKEAADKVAEFNDLIADKVSTQQLAATNASIDTLRSDMVKVTDELDTNKLDANEAEITYAKIARVEAVEGRIDDLESDKITTEQLDANYVKASTFEALQGEVDELEANNANFKEATTNRLNANDAAIEELEANKLTTESADIRYANIDFSNIGKAAIEYFYVKSGLIEDVIVGDGTITGRLVGVTLSGDLIEGNTIVAEKLVIKGEDGLYYKLNTDGVTNTAEQTEYNSINGQVIMAKSITATQISVSDLVAFDATIGGFTITDDSIYSEVKDGNGNVARGVHLGADGQVNFGDASNFIKYYKDDDGLYRLAISAASIMYALNGKQYSIADLGLIGDYVHITTYDGEPCIELGESDSDFKLLITNTRIMFMEGSDVPAYINNRSLHIKKAVVKEELCQGGFVWKVRSNGNMGLVWKGEA